MAPKQDSEGTVAVNVEELRNSKDAVITRLMAVQSYLADLSKAYVEHANSVINGGPATIDVTSLPMNLHSHVDWSGIRATSPGAKSEAGGAKKRKRAPVDPNAPKRALTPYFLFLQSNRAQMAKDLGESAKPKDVTDELTRRWQTMDEKEREVWKKLYLENFENYKKQMAAYKAGLPVKGDDDHDPAASQLQQDFAGAESAVESTSESEDESDSEDESPSPPPKEKTPPRSANKRRKSDAKKESPVKKGKGKSAEPASATKGPESTKRKGKKRKSDAGQ